VRGAEVEAATRLPRDFGLQLGAAVARGEDADTGAALDDIAAPVVHASLRWAVERVSAFVTVSRYGDDDRPGPVETARPGHTNVDLGAGWRILPRMELRVAIRNATNSLHFGSTDAVASVAPGRTFVIGINR
jgi:outer membrane receptor protein involved in Fe transport